ncbi:hypothetical protein lerEdw1_013108, partial [Lerista edwardsae]
KLSLSLILFAVFQCVVGERHEGADLDALPVSEMQGWDKECGPDICAQVVALAEDFLLRRQEPERHDEGKVSLILEQDPPGAAKLQEAKQEAGKEAGLSAEVCEFGLFDYQK